MSEDGLDCMRLSVVDGVWRFGVSWLGGGDELNNMLSGSARLLVDCAEIIDRQQADGQRQARHGVGSKVPCSYCTYYIVQRWLACTMVSVNVTIPGFT